MIDTTKQIKKITYYFKKLKMKYFLNSDVRANLKGKLVKDKNIVVLKKHYCLVREGVQTTHGKGSIVTPITHHRDEYLPKALHGKHIIEDHVDKNGLCAAKHPDNHTGTLSNSRYFINNENLNSSDLDKKIEFSDRNSLLKRVSSDNFLNHMDAHLKQREEAAFDIVTQTYAEVLSISETGVDLHSMSAEKTAHSISILYNYDETN